MVVEKKVATLLLFAAIFAAIFAAVQGQGWEYCLSTPTVEVEIHVVVRGDLAKVEICDSQHFMDYLKNTIYDDFNKTSTEDCSFKLEGYTSCKPLQEGEVPRKAITFKSNLTCGGRCINHINNQTTEMEHSRQYNSIHEAMNIFTRTEHKYNQTDVIIRFFRGEKKSIFFACNGIEAAEGILCECPEECEPKEVTFSFREPEYSFVENMDNATIHIYRVSGSTDRAVTLTVSGSIQGELINQEVMFGPNDIEKAITFKILDDDIPLEPTEQFELSLNSTDRNVQFEPHGKTTINIIDDEENLCLATPRVAVNIYVVVRGDEEDDVDVCDSRHFMDALKRRIYRDFEETSGGAMCHFILDDYDFCTNIALGNKSRTAITFKTNLTCGDRCFNHTDDQTSMMEIDHQYDVINATMNINVVEILDYNQTSVVIRYFYQEEGPVVYACRDTSYVYVTQDRNLPLCDCSDECNDTVRDVSFTFRQPVYSFFENVGTATIHLDKVEGSFDETITLLVSGVIQSRTINKRITFDPTDNSKVITFFITDDEVPSEPTEEFELSLAGTQGRYNILFDPNQKTTINILDNDVSFSFGKPVYKFFENMGTVTIHVDKVNGSFDQPIILFVSGVIQGELIDETITFGPNDTKIPITFEITDDVIPLEPTEVFELSLNGTDTKYNLLLEPNNKTTINIVDDDAEDLCLAAPRVAVNIYVVVRGDDEDDVDICDSRHFMRDLKKRIYSDFRETSGGAMCHFRLDNYDSCTNFALGEKHRTAITFKTDLICGDRCFKYIDDQTSIMEIDGQYDVINATMNINKREILEYNQTSVVIRYFYQEEGPVVYTCRDTSYVHVIQDRNLILCECPKDCEVTFSFREPEYSFVENMDNATIHVDRVSGSTDRAVTLTVSGSIQGELINQEVMFGPNEIKKAITFKIPDGDIPLEPTEQSELSLNSTDRNVQFKPHDKTTINIIDDEAEGLCLATPRVAVNIYVVVRGNEEDDVDICDSQHFMHVLKRRINSDFRETSGGAMCHFILDDYDSCTNIALGAKHRTAITFKTNLICGDRCFKHSDDQTSIMEIDHQYDVINATMNINVVEILDYNQTSVVIRYFYQEEGPVVYACRDTSYVHVTQDRNTTLCDCDRRCFVDPVRDVSFTFRQPVYSFFENVGTATIHLDKVEGSFDEPITMSVSGAIQGELIHKTVTFGPNDSEISITFKITDDVIPLEPTEVFELSLNGTDTKYNLLFEPNDKTTISVVDDDGERDEDVCLSTPTSEMTIYVVVRGRTDNEVCGNQHLKDFLEKKIYSDFREISKDECHLGPDYQASCNSLLLNNTPRTAITITVNLTCGSSCIQHTYRETSILEINRQENAINEISILTVKKHRYSQTSDVVIRYFYGVKKPVFYFCENKEIGSIEGTNLKLCNCSDECKDPVRDVTFTFDKPVYNFIENMYNATIYVEKTSSSIDRVITLLVTGFSQGPLTVHFYPQDIRKPINFRILDNDIVLEPTEKIELLLSPTDRISLIKPHEKAIINIMDDDELLIGFTTQRVTVMEGNYLTLCVNFSSEFVTNFNIDVQYLLTNLSTYHPAAINEDSKFTIEANSTVHGPNKLLCFNILAIQDDFVEHKECSKIGISIPTSVSDRFMVELDEGKDTTVICIEDDDRVRIGFVEPEIEVPENITDGKKSICVNVTHGRLMREVTVMAQYQNYSADDGKDYRGEMHTLTFSQDVTQVCFQVAILDDYINEEDEFFTVLLTTTDQNVTLSPNSINIKIKDDDVVHIGFIGPPFEGKEKDGIVTVTFGVLGHMKLDEAVPVTLNTLDISNINNAAEAGVDYKNVNSKFNLSNEYITVRIELINDNFLEGDEDFMVQLQIEHTGRNIELFKDNAIVTIVDDDSITIGFEKNDTMVEENDQFHTLCLKVLEGELRRTTVVSVSYQNRSAIRGEDYIATHSTTFEFSQNNDRRCFSFTIRDDTEAEPEESFFITATTGDPQVKLSPSIAKVSIKDNDCPEGSIFNDCGSACPPTCNQPTPLVCLPQCVKGCFCTDNKIKHNGECISLEECPTTTTK